MDDHVRFFMEECDCPQGFQILSDADNGFTGLTSELLLRLQDDYSKKSIFTVSVGMDSLEEDHLKSYNRSLAVHHYSQGSSLYIPLIIPDLDSIKTADWSKYLFTNTSSQYHWSGYLSAVFQTMLFPVHFPINGRCMSQIEMSSIFKKNNDSPLAALNVIMPFPIWSADSGLIQDTLKVLRPGQYHSISLNLTTRRPFDKVLFYNKLKL